jgi:hypothetical protein
MTNSNEIIIEEVDFKVGIPVESGIFSSLSSFFADSIRSIHRGAAEEPNRGAHPERLDCVQ